MNPTTELNVTALDTLQEKVEEARRTQENASPGEDFINTTDALLAAHRALVVAELAGETDAETLEKAVDAAAHSVTGDGDSYREVVGIELRAAAPHIRAPLAAKLVEAEMERLRKMDEDNQFGYVALRLKLDAAEARVASLEAALEKYGSHHTACPNFVDAAVNPATCLCGFDVALGGPV